MPDTATPAPPDAAALARDVLADAKTMVDQQISLVRAEVREAVGRAGTAAGAVAGGGVLMAVGGLFGGMMLAHLLHKGTGLPLWAAYGAVGAAAAGTGHVLMRAGANQLTDLPLLPRSAEALQENVSWLHRRLTQATG